MYFVIFNFGADGYSFLSEAEFRRMVFRKKYVVGFFYYLFERVIDIFRVVLRMVLEGTFYKFV